MAILSGIRGVAHRLGPGALAGIALVIAAVVALVWANSSAAESYHSIWSTVFTISMGAFGLSKPVILWVNDALMAVFFLLVGLEIKREVLEGALSTARRAALPLFAAVGGMVVPAAIFVLFNFGGEGATGWAIPAATDIAFALGILALLGKRVPVELKIFLTAVAVVDDLGAVLVIALFYTSELAVGPLVGAAVVLGAAFAANRMKVGHPLPYILAGILLWFFVLKSGVHATVAGVLLALAIPSRGLLSPEAFEQMGRGIFRFEESEDEDELAPHTRAHEMRALTNRVEPMLLRWEHALQPWVMFLIMPIFAFANAGVTVGDVGAETLTAPVTLGVMLGLLLGKPIGVTAMAWLAVKLNLAELPSGVTWLQLHGAGWLAGIGFTMSLFVTALAFEPGALTTEAKVGLLAGSFLAGLIGTILLYVAGSVRAPSRP